MLVVLNHHSSEPPAKALQVDDHLRSSHSAVARRRTPRRGTDNVRAVALAAALTGLGCAHNAPDPPTPLWRCGDERIALRVAQDFAAQTEQSDGVKLRLDESRVTNEASQWKIWTHVGEGRGPKDAYLVVRKVDCAADWALILYQM